MSLKFKVKSLGTHGIEPLIRLGGKITMKN